MIRLVHSLLLAATLTAQADTSVTSDTGWEDAQRVLLDVNFPDQQYHARYDFHHCSCGDVFVDVEQTAPDLNESGQMLLLGGKLLLVTGLEEGGAPTDVLMDAPSLMMQLYLALVHRAQPLGPSAVTARQAVDRGEQLRPLTLDTGFANGEFGAPWNVKGEIFQGQQQRYRADLEFTFSMPTADGPPTACMVFSATMEFGEQPFPVDEGFDLSGWRAAWLGADDDQPETELSLESLATARAWLP